METKERIAIVTDSCADIPQETARRYSIFILPMVITTSEGEYQDGIDMTAQDIYEIQKSEMPKTGCPTGAAVMDTFEEIQKAGYTKAIVILLSGGLSGTVNSIKLLTQGIRGMEIAVFDSRKASIGIGAIAIQAAEYVQNGCSYEQVKQNVGSLITDTKVFFSIDTLEYLEKGGRIGKVTAMAGTFLKIKPILSFDEEGEIYTAAKVRGTNMVETKLVQLVEEFAGNRKLRYNIIVADGGAPAEGEALEKRMKEAFPDYEKLFRARIGAALSVYLGKGLLGAGIQFLD